MNQEPQSVNQRRNQKSLKTSEAYIKINLPFSDGASEEHIILLIQYLGNYFVTATEMLVLLLLILLLLLIISSITVVQCF